MSEPPVVIQRLQSRMDTKNAYCCMAEVPTPWPEALCHCREWISQNLGRHVEGYHLQLPGSQVIGHIYYALSEQALFPYQVEAGVGIIYCEWVQQRYQGQGYGRRLFDVFLADMRVQGVKGILVEGSDYEGHMHYKHFQARGFEVVHQAKHNMLLYLPLSQPNIHLQPLEPRINPQHRLPVEIVIINGYLCPYEVATQMIILQVAKEFGERVTLKQVWLTPDILKEYGSSRGIFINGRQKLTGGESEQEVRQSILEEVQRA